MRQKLQSLGETATKKKRAVEDVFRMVPEVTNGFGFRKILTFIVKEGGLVSMILGKNIKITSLKRTTTTVKSVSRVSKLLVFAKTNEMRCLL